MRGIGFFVGSGRDGGRRGREDGRGVYYNRPACFDPEATEARGTDDRIPSENLCGLEPVTRNTRLDLHTISPGK